MQNEIEYKLKKLDLVNDFQIYISTNRLKKNRRTSK